MWNQITHVWCKTMHARAMWPIHGKYICQKCLQEYPIAWEGPARQAEYADPALRHATEAVPYTAEQRLC